MASRRSPKEMLAERLILYALHQEVPQGYHNQNWDHQQSVVRIINPKYDPSQNAGYKKGECGLEAVIWAECNEQVNKAYDAAQPYQTLVEQLKNIFNKHNFEYNRSDVLNLIQDYTANFVYNPNINGGIGYKYGSNALTVETLQEFVNNYNLNLKPEKIIKQTNSDVSELKHQNPKGYDTSSFAPTKKMKQELEELKTKCYCANFNGDIQGLQNLLPKAIKLAGECMDSDAEATFLGYKDNLFELMNPKD